MQELIKDKHIATHKILTFDVDGSGCMRTETIRILFFSGTTDMAIKKAIEWREQRNKEEPLGTDEEWGKLNYIAHIWTLDECGNEDKLIAEL